MENDIYDLLEEIAKELIIDAKEVRKLCTITEDSVKRAGLEGSAEALETYAFRFREKQMIHFYKEKLKKINQ